MKTLYLMRHAKSSWNDSSLSDFDRPLNDRGLRAVPKMGSFMKLRGLRPSIVVSSPANRAKATADLVVESGMFGIETRFDERIYEASPQRLLHVLSVIDDGFDTAMIVGHNPGMEGLIRVLTGELEPMPTAALAVLDLDIDRWADVSQGSGKLREIIRPRELK